MNNIPIICPSCHYSLGLLSKLPQTIICPDCQTQYSCNEGIWNFILPKRLKLFAQFLEDYKYIRKAEGRGSADLDYYLKLPYVSPDTPLSWQWSIRAKSYRLLNRRILPAIGKGLRILDLGAGICWLSYRLDEERHLPCAVDINTDPLDGLAAANYYSSKWPCIQAEFDDLPIAESCIDVVIFNASLPYSTDFATTFTEVLRVLKPKGYIIVMDSPVYKHVQSGEKMIKERKKMFLKNYCTNSDAIPSRGFMTWKGLKELAETFNLTYRIYRPWYGLKWALRPLKAFLYHQREPSTFAIIVFQKNEFFSKHIA